MTLNQYIEIENSTLVKFCLANNFDYGYLKHIKAGRARPSPKMALKIEKATRGKVSRLELLYP